MTLEPKPENKIAQLQKEIDYLTRNITYIQNQALNMQHDLRCEKKLVRRISVALSLSFFINALTLIFIICILVPQ